MNEPVARTVLVFSHVAPPQANAGAARVEAFARHLPEFGWRPLVVASAFAGDGKVSGALTARPSEPLVWFQRHVRSEATGTAARPRRVKRLVEGLAVPDLHAGWVPPAVWAAVRLVRTQSVAALFSTSPPESSHLAAMLTSIVTGLPWVAELRDGWTLEGLRELDGHPWRRRVEVSLERSVGNRASALVGVTRPISRDLEARFGTGTWIPNGFDNDPISPSAMREAREILDEGAFNFVYTGRFAESRKTRSPNVLADAFCRLERKSPARPLSLTVVGRLTSLEKEILGRAPRIRVFDHRPPAVAKALQRLADALVVVTMPGEYTVATGKLFEYLGAARPILALAEGNEAAALLAELGVGLTVDPRDPEAIAQGILRVADGGIPAADPTQPPVSRFHRRAVTGQLAFLLDQVSPGAGA